MKKRVGGKAAEKNLFGKRLEELSGSKGATIRDLAAYVGIDDRTYEAWVAGKNLGEMSIENIRCLAEFLEADFLELLRLSRPELVKLYEIGGYAPAALIKTSDLI